MYKQKTAHLVKICGNKYVDNGLKVAECKPDMMGWIFAPSSPRCCQVPLEIASQIATIRKEYSAIRHVAVFAGNSVDEIIKIIDCNCFDLAQIAGDASLIATVRSSFLSKKDKKKQEKFSILPAIRVNRKITNNSLDAYGRESLFVLDSFVVGEWGGTGKNLDTNLISAVTYSYLLAGGLTAENVTQALKRCLACGADASSGLEDDVPGRKNIDKVTAFIQAVRSLSV